MADLLERIRGMGPKFSRRARLHEAYKAVFGSADGKRVLADILKHAGVLETSMIAGDAHMTAFNEGKRALALGVLGELRWNPMDLLALAEQRGDEETRDILERAA